MRFAVASQNFRTITPHAGRTRRFIIFEAEPGAEPEELDRLELPAEMSMHEFHDVGPHPLDSADVLLVGSCGRRFRERMAARGVKAVSTGETDPRQAIRDYFAGAMKPSSPEAHDHPEGGEGGHHQHGGGGGGHHHHGEGEGGHHHRGGRGHRHGGE